MHLLYCIGMNENVHDRLSSILGVFTDPVLPRALAAPMSEVNNRQIQSKNFVSMCVTACIERSPKTEDQKGYFVRVILDLDPFGGKNRPSPLLIFR